MSAPRRGRSTRSRERPSGGAAQGRIEQAAGETDLAGATALSLTRLTARDSLAPLRLLRSLQELLFVRCELSDLAPLAALSALRSVDFVDCEVPDLAPLARLPALSRLGLRERTRAPGLAPLARCPALRALEFGRNVPAPKGLELPPTQVRASLKGRADLASLAAFPELTWLDLRCALNGTERWPALPRLRALRLGSPVQTALRTSAGLATLTSLQVLVLTGTHAMDRLEGIQDLRDLRTLSVANTGVTDLASLRGLALASLGASQTRVATLEGLRLEALVRLDASRTPLGALAGVTDLPALEELSLRECGDLRDVGALRGARRLRRLDLAGSLAARDWSRLDALPALEVLDVSRTGVDDARLVERLPSLTELDIRETPLASRPEAVRAMTVELERRQGWLRWEGRADWDRGSTSRWPSFAWPFSAGGPGD